ncbi:MAG: glycogen debranching enzyme N-terminal domain-containing protein, partial [Stellaceae bacterium]
MVELRRSSRDENPLPEAPREWLVANGLGGYASATVTGAITRRYHGFLIAAQPAPLGRMVVLNDIEVDIELEDGSVVNLREKGRFLDFTLSMGLPSWRYELDGLVIEKSIVVPSRQNIVHSTFRSLGDGRRVRLRVRPLIDFRPLEAPVGEALSSGYTLTIRGDRYEVSAGPDLPTLRLAVEGAEGPTFTADGGVRRERFYDIEAQRGYDSRGWLWSPGYFAGEIRKDCPLTLIAAT